MRHVHQVLRASLGPSHGPPQRDRSFRYNQVLGIGVELRAEPSAHVRRDGSNQSFVQTHCLGHIGSHVERHLRGNPYRQAPAFLGDHRDAIGLHRGRRKALVHEPPARHHICPGQRVLVPLMFEPMNHVGAALRPQEGCRLALCGLRIGHRLQRVIVGQDQFGRIFSLRERLRYDHGDGFAHESNHVAGKHLPGE